MKTPLIALLSVSSLLAMYSCGDKDLPQPQQPTQAAQKAPEPDGPTKVESVIGQAEVRKLSDSTWKGLKVGQKLGTSLELSTKEESSLGLALANGTQFSMGELSVVVMDSLLLDAEQQKARFDVQKGKLAFNVRKLAQGKTDIEFRTRNMTAAVRGTEGEIGSENGKDVLTLREGLVAVHNLITGKDTSVSANQKIEVDAKGKWVISTWTPPAKIDSVSNAKSVNTQTEAVQQPTSALGRASSPTTSKVGASSKMDAAKVGADMHQSLSTQNQDREKLEAQGAAERKKLEEETARAKAEAQAKADREKAEADAKVAQEKRAADERKQKERDAMAEARKKLGMQNTSDLKHQMMEDAQRMKGN